MRGKHRRLRAEIEARKRMQAAGLASEQSDPRYDSVKADAIRAAVARELEAAPDWID
ncbi:MAG: hypothetical protein R3C15_19595 [Thermoleophilia bacterium]